MIARLNTAIDQHLKLWFVACGVLAIAALVWGGVRATRNAHEVATRMCRVDLVTGETVAARGCYVANGWAEKGQLRCEGVTYGPAAWVALRCER